MLCKISGCEKEATYKTQGVCQKHYFRFMRYGTYELTHKPRRILRKEWNGYIRVYEPSHSLADCGGFVAEHRKVVYDDIGELLSCCSLCGKFVDWSSVHIDHIDANKKNNARENLRPLCRVCNTFRQYPAQHTMSGRHGITYEGVTKTSEEWSRHPGVYVSGTAIRHRLKKGMSVEDALFSKKRTHNVKQKAKESKDG